MSHNFKKIAFCTPFMCDQRLRFERLRFVQKKVCWVVYDKTGFSQSTFYCYCNSCCKSKSYSYNVLELTAQFKMLCQLFWAILHMNRVQGISTKPKIQTNQKETDAGFAQEQKIKSTKENAVSVPCGFALNTQITLSQPA